MTLRLKLEAHLENGEIVWEELRCRIAIQIISFHSEVPERVRTRFTDIDWKAVLNYLKSSVSLSQRCRSADPSAMKSEKTVRKRAKMTILGSWWFRGVFRVFLCSFCCFFLPQMIPPNCA